MLKLELIQAEMEEIWRNRATGSQGTRCPWCEWANDCSMCPLAVAFDLHKDEDACSEFPPYLRWAIAHVLRLQEQLAAEELYHILVENRELILLAAHDILRFREEMSDEA